MRIAGTLLLIAVVAVGAVMVFRHSVSTVEVPIALVPVDEEVHFGPNAKFVGSQNPVYVAYFPFVHEEGTEIKSNLVFTWSDEATSVGGYGGVCIPCTKDQTPLYKYAYVHVKDGPLPTKMTIEGKTFICKVVTLPELQKFIDENVSQLQ